MQVKIIKVGNSKGLRLSKTLIDKYDIQEKVELILKDEGILLKPIANPREGWDKQFKQMHQLGDDKLLINDVFEEEEFDE